MDPGLFVLLSRWVGKLIIVPARQECLAYPNAGYFSFFSGVVHR